RALHLGMLVATISVASPAAAAHRRAAPPAPAQPPPASPQAPAQPPAGDFVHTPAEEQASNTPPPVYVEASGVQVSRVVVKYRGAKMKEWARLAMKRMVDGWGALIPCGAVQAGTVLYWIQGFDPSGEPAASSGDPKLPFSVPIRDAITSEAPHLPGRAAPQACTGAPEQAPSEAPPETPASEEPSRPVASSGPTGEA